MKLTKEENKILSIAVILIFLGGILMGLGISYVVNYYL